MCTIEICSFLEAKISSQCVIKTTAHLSQAHWAWSFTRNFGLSSGWNTDELSLYQVVRCVVAVYTYTSSCVFNAELLPSLAQLTSSVLALKAASSSALSTPCESWLPCRWVSPSRYTRWNMRSLLVPHGIGSCPTKPVFHLNDYNNSNNNNY